MIVIVIRMIIITIHTFHHDINRKIFISIKDI